LPIAGRFTFDNEFRRTTVTKRKTGSVGVNPGTAAIAHGQTDTTVFRNVNAIEAIFLGGESGFGCI
jgi:hypothetical protein